MSAPVLERPVRLIIGSAPSRSLTRKEVLAEVTRFRRTAGAAVIEDFSFKPGFVYNTVRAISARVNQNYDAWPSEELKVAYKTFLGKPCFVNHHNEDPELARGVVIAARYVEKGADKYVETIMETDGQRFPLLGHELRTGGLDSVSMGVEAGFTICSICENRASDIFDMCNHVKFHKGEYLRHPKTGKKTLVYENCHKLGFFELSYVFDPADETAVISRVIAAGRDLAPRGSNDQFQQYWLRQADMPGSAPVAPTPGKAAIGGGGQFKGLTPTTGDTSWHQPTVGVGSSAGVEAGPTPGSIKEPGGPSFTPAPNVTYDDGSGGSSGGLFPSLFGSRELPFFQQHWLRQAFGETRAPKEVDTLRDDGEDQGGDWTRDPHKEWIEQTARRRHADDTDIPWQSDIESPPELQAPDLDATKRLDRDQEGAGLDGDRHAEDAEEFGVPSPDGQMDPDYDDDDDSENQPAMPINPPGSKRGRRTSYRGAPMSRSRSRYAADEDQYPDEGDPSQQQEDPDALVSEAEDDLDAYDQQNGGGGDDFGGGGYDDDDGSDDSGYEDDDGGDDSDAPPWADGGGDDDSGEDDHPDAAYDDGGDADGGGGDDAPPWLHENREGRRRAQRPVKKRSGRGNRRAAAARGGEMPRQSLATRQRTAQQYGNQPRRHFAGDDGHMDGGPYGVDDSQGAQEDIFISQVPGAEAVDLGDDEGGIPNNPGNLVASRGRFDPDHYQRLADVISTMPPEQRHAVAYKMALACKQDNPAFNWRTLYTAAKVPLPRRTAEELTHPDKVDPPLPDTGASDIKGSEFESLALDNVETQPKDASIHAFQQFDRWLAKATGKTARQHGNANYIRRAAVSYSKATRNPEAALQGLFPTLDFVLHHARNSEQTKEANMRRHAEDESLDVAAPGGRIDVEAPVKNVTDADAQSSQFDLGDFAGNASDGLADPVLDAVDGNAGTWAPDKEARVVLATATEALRCAEAHIAAMPDKYTQDDRWQLVARFETLRGPVVRDRTRMLEDAVRYSRSARKVTAGRSRGTNGIPPGLGSGRRTSSRREGSVNDPRNPATDGALFF